MKNGAGLWMKNGFQNLITDSRISLPSVLENQVVLLPLTAKFITQK